MRIPTILAALFVPLLAAAPGTGKKLALVVGINRYAGADLTELAYAENDAVELARVLRSEACRFDRVVLLTSKERPTTAASIRLALAGLLAGTTKDDVVLVALAGHGVQLEIRDPAGKGEPKRYSYFCASDTDLTRVSYRTGHADTMINLEHLFETLGRSNAGAKLVLMDACRNELKLKGSMRNLSEDSLAMPARVLALLSCGKKQRAYEVDHLKHGLFFHHVLQGLRGKARNPRGEVTWASLTDHVAHEVQAEAKKLDREQTPTTVSGEYAGVSPVLARVTGLPPRPRVDDGRFVTNGLGMKLARVPAGEALVGSPAGEKDRKPDEVRRVVKIPRPFLLGVHEVTQKQFRDVMGYNPSYFSRDGTGRKGGEYPLHQPAGGRDRVEGDADGLPVENVSWDEAREFCEKLSVQPAEKKAGRVYRLPTEAEWEYACRAGTTTAFHVGDSLTKGHANFTQILRRTAPVGNYPANPWGLRDMHGNVAEWCADVYEVKGTARVVRGGNWAFAAGVARSAARQGMPPSFRANAFGFRVAAEAGE